MPTHVSARLDARDLARLEPVAHKGADIARGTLRRRPAAGFLGLPARLHGVQMKWHSITGMPAPNARPEKHEPRKISSRIPSSGRVPTVLLIACHV